jgi:hypothetical protein
VLVADGAGVTTAEGDVGTAVGLGPGVPAFRLGLAGRVLGVGRGVVVDRDGAGVELAGAVGWTGAGVSVADRAGRTYR